MTKMVSVAISVVLLFLADRSALEWHRLRAVSNQAGRKPDLAHANETPRLIGPQSVPTTNFVLTNIIETGKF
jgi:hypothetical protein